MDVRLVCFDIDGTLTDGMLGTPLEGAAEAVARLRAALPVRFVTNATSLRRRRIFEHLAAHGFTRDPTELETPLTAAERVLRARGHDAGLLIAEPETRAEASWFREDAAGPSVLVGGEVHGLTIAALQPAFRRVLDGAAFYTVQRNRYFRRGGELVTDVGPLAAFLEYAAGTTAQVLGKPSALLFDDIARSAGLRREQLLMIGDDAEFAQRSE